MSANVPEEFRSRPLLRRKVSVDHNVTHVCACRAKLLSSGIGLTVVLNLSLSNSTRSIPEDAPSPQSLLLLPESDVNDGTADVLALEPRCGGEVATRLYGAG